MKLPIKLVVDIQISEVEQHLSKPSGNGNEETDKPAVGFGHERRVSPLWRLKNQQLQVNTQH